MSRIYYRGAAAAVVCYDVTNADSWERLGFWVRELRKIEENCRVYLCACKLDLLKNRRRRPVDYHNTVDFAEEEGATLFETSSKTGENVEELFLQIARDYLQRLRNEEEEEEKRRRSNSVVRVTKAKDKTRRPQCCN